MRLHQILDALPSALGGESLLTILWPGFDAIDEDGSGRSSGSGSRSSGGGFLPDDHVELFGALKRARDWFDARLFIRVEDSADSSKAASLWCALLDATALSSSHFTGDVIFDQSLLWTGVVADKKDRFRLFSTDILEEKPVKEKTKNPRHGNVVGTGVNPDADNDVSVRLICSHSMKVKKSVPRHKVPLHRICSEPEFYLTPHSMSLASFDENDAVGNSNILGHIFPSACPNASDFVLLSLDFAIEGKPVPTNKDNGAGRRPWDKLAASTSGSTSGCEDPAPTPADFIFHRPHLTSELKDVRDKRSIEFLAFPTTMKDAAIHRNDNDDIPCVKLLRLRQEMEMNPVLFDGVAVKTTPAAQHESTEAVDESFLQALDQLPSLHSADIFSRCVQAKSDGEDIDSFLANIETKSPTSKSKGASPDAALPDLPSPLDIFYLRDDADDDSRSLRRFLDGSSSLLKEGEKPDHGNLSLDASAAGGLLQDVAALVQADVQDDPFCSKIRAEDILAKYRPRLEQLLGGTGAGEEVGKRRRECSFEGATIAGISWPDVKEIQWHDVYYNRGLESEEKAQEIHLLKVGDRERSRDYFEC